jgi:hypothetical protein
MKDEDFFGSANHWVTKQEAIEISDLERTVLDGLRHPEYCGGITDVAKAANWDEPPSEEAPFATTLYPGGHDIATASRVHAEQAGPVALADFRLPTATKCTVQIQLEDSASKSNAGAKILTKYFPEQFWHPVADVGPGGRAIVTVVGPNLMYLVASRPISNQQELRSAVKTIQSCPTVPIRLRLISARTLVFHVCWT